MAKNGKAVIIVLEFKTCKCLQTFLGSFISPYRALAAAVAGDERYTKASGLPCLPLKFLFDVESPTSPLPRSPNEPPIHGPQHGDSTIAPASMNCSTYPARRVFIYSVCEAGIISRRTPFATFSPFIILATISISSKRPLVHERTNTWSIFVPSTSSTDFTLSTLCGQATCGERSLTSYCLIWANDASSSLFHFGSSAKPGILSLRYFSVVLSASTIPAFPPISIAMLDMVILPGISIFLTVEPQNSAVM